MRLTRKKREAIVSDNLVDLNISLKIAHNIIKAIGADKALLNDNLKRAYNDASAKINFFQSQLEESYKKDLDASKFIQNSNGFIHLDEIAMQGLEKIQEVANKYKV